MQPFPYNNTPVAKKGLSLVTHLQHTPMKRITCGLLFALTIGICLPGAGQDLAETAKAFMALLTAEQLEKATFPVDTDERTDWTFVPRARKGIPFNRRPLGTIYAFGVGIESGHRTPRTADRKTDPPTGE